MSFDPSFLSTKNLYTRQSSLTKKIPKRVFIFIPAAITFVPEFLTNTPDQMLEGSNSNCRFNALFNFDQVRMVLEPLIAKFRTIGTEEVILVSEVQDIEIFRKTLNESVLSVTSSPYLDVIDTLKAGGLPVTIFSMVNSCEDRRNLERGATTKSFDANFRINFKRGYCRVDDLLNEEITEEDELVVISDFSAARSSEAVEGMPGKDVVTFFSEEFKQFSRKFTEIFLHNIDYKFSYIIESYEEMVELIGMDYRNSWKVLRHGKGNREILLSDRGSYPTSSTLESFSSIYGSHSQGRPDFPKINDFELKERPIPARNINRGSYMNFQLAAMWHYLPQRNKLIKLRQLPPEYYLIAEVHEDLLVEIICDPDSKYPANALISAKVVMNSMAKSVFEKLSVKRIRPKDISLKGEFFNVN